MTAHNIMFIAICAYGIFLCSISVSTAFNTLPSDLGFARSKTSYAGLLVHYLTQEVKPKFHLCVNVLSKIVEREGPDRAIRLSEALQYNISADKFRMTKNALLSALVIQKQTDAATSHLKQLLLQQWQLDSSVVADLMQLYMVADTSIDTTSQRRMYQKRALEASLLYGDLMDAQVSVPSHGRSSDVQGKSLESGSQATPWTTISTSTVAAADRIHEYGARAFAVTGEWEKAIAAMTCIGERHLVSDRLVLFSSQVLDRLMKIKAKKVDQQRLLQTSLGNQTQSNVELQFDNISHSLALEFALLQPLPLLAIDSPLLHSSLLLLSAAPKCMNQLVESIREIHSRNKRVGVAESARLGSKEQGGDGSASTLLPSKVSLMLVQRLFLNGCETKLLIEAVVLLWGSSSNSAKNVKVISPRSSVEISDTVSKTGKSAAEADDANAVASIINAACLLRDSKQSNQSQDQRDQALTARQFALHMAEIPAKVIRALTTTNTGEIMLAAAVNPSLCVLLLSLRGAGLQEEACATLQSIADLDNNGSRESVWAPDPDLLSQALGLGGSSIEWTESSAGVDVYESLAAYRDVRARILDGYVPNEYVLTALFRAATMLTPGPPSSLTAAKTLSAASLWTAMIDKKLSYCWRPGPVLSTALRFGFNTMGVEGGLSRGLQICHDSLEVSVSIIDSCDNVEIDAALDTTVRGLFLGLRQLQMPIVGISGTEREVGDAPAAILSLARAIRGRVEGNRSGVLSVSQDMLLLGGLISLGVSGNGGESERKTDFRYSSTLRLSIYLDSLPPSQLQSLLPVFMGMGEGWPKTTLRAFNHLQSTKENGNLSHLDSSNPNPTAVSLVLQAFDQILITAMKGVNSPSSNHESVKLEDPISLEEAFNLYSHRMSVNQGQDSLPPVPSSETLAAAMDLCSSRSDYDEIEEKSIRFARCRLYYDIGWTAVTSEASHCPSDSVDMEQNCLLPPSRHLGLSLNQLSAAQLRAVQRLNRSAAEAIRVVKQKIEFFSDRMPLPLPLTATSSENASNGNVVSTLTQATAAAVTYKETRLLSVIASTQKGEHRQLADFWSSTLTTHPHLMGYSTALFELLDALMAAGDRVALLAWTKKAVESMREGEGEGLPAMRVKELLLRYSSTPSLECLPILLPLLARLCTGTEGDLHIPLSTPVWKSYKRSVKSGLFLPLSMSVLKDICVRMLGQGRLSDATVLLQCVHPLQRPYDLLLQVLATDSSSTGADNAGTSVHKQKGGKERMRECMAVLQEREREGLSLSLPPVSGATARALLAIHMQTDEEEKAGRSNGGDAAREKDREVQLSFRTLVARAVVKSEGWTEVGDVNDVNANNSWRPITPIVGTNNNNGRISSDSHTSKSRAISEEDVRSGLMALLTLHSLTDTQNATTEKSSEESQTVTAPETQIGLTGAVAVESIDVLDNETVALPAPAKWDDPQSPENLFKFLADLEGLGTGPKVTKTDEEREKSRSVGLRVSGSKKSWKKRGGGGGSFGLSFSSDSEVDVDMQQSNSYSVTSALSKVGMEIDSVDVDTVVCRELSNSLLDTVTAQIASLEKKEERESEFDHDFALGPLGDRWEGGKGRELQDSRNERTGYKGRKIERDREVSIIGAVEELFSLDNQVQADRLFSTPSQAMKLCHALLSLSALKGDSASAALVVQQMDHQRLLLKGPDDSETWKRLHRIMVDGAHGSSNGPDTTVWGNLKKIFTAIRSSLMTQLKATESNASEIYETRDMYVRMLELGTLSHLKELKGSGSDSELGTDEDEIDGGEGEEEYWLKTGEREKLKEIALVEEEARRALRLAALSSSRSITLDLVQQLPSLGLLLTDLFGSELITSFLSLSCDVDSSLSILNLLLKGGGHPSHSSCELLAKGLLAKGRKDMARAICRLLHSRGGMCDLSLYSSLFESMLAVAPSLTSSFSLSPTSSLDIDDIDGMMDDLYHDKEWEASPLEEEIEGGVDLRLVAVNDSLELLEEIVAAGTANTITIISSSRSTVLATENRLNKIANSLTEILVRLGYRQKYLNIVDIATSKRKKQRIREY